MNQLVQMSLVGFPLWVPNIVHRQLLINEEFHRDMFQTVANVMRPPSVKVEGTRHTEIFMMDHFHLVDIFHGHGSLKCRKMPSGCIIQGASNGVSRVTWIEHVEVEDQGVHPLGKPIVDSFLAFGAERWLAVLARQLERDPKTRRDILKLAEKMVWDVKAIGEVQEIVRITNGHEVDNCVSLSQVISSNANTRPDDELLVLEECITDPTSSCLIYARMDA
ncbi:OLC1v1025037C1 [Oldenlandia corymbosa var. corymbosa]|uniref:OLC1v1025037C1 n=1 Tax=Oldenlandia corymbosa var. corymbosa TaxID=529605 RepID=A0AAV1C4A2_OLDCO|nr:OLC1v1025037C1 [Oldenlandia corymbosa var. corymbosa]